MRDAVYGMQLGRRLREMHREAAESIEETYADDLAPHYADLAYHYGRTEDTDKELRYVRLAGERAVIWYATAEAVRFFSRALELTSEEDLPERYALTLAREKGYDLQGMREAQSQDLMALEHLAKVLSGDERQIETALRRANYAIMIGDYSAVVDAAQTAIRLARTGQMAHFEAMGHLYCFKSETGNVLWSRDLNKEYDIEMPIWGIAAAPLIVENKIIIQIGGSNNACVIALDKRNGKEIWRNLKDDANYSAPILIKQGNQSVVVVWTGQHVVGLFDFDWSKIDLRCFDVGLAIWYLTHWNNELDGIIRLAESLLFLKTYQSTLANLPHLEPLDAFELQHLPVMINLANFFVLNWTVSDYYAIDADPGEYLVYLQHSVRFNRWFMARGNQFIQEFLINPLTLDEN